jgi:NADH dehydrogenase [ubiquinone] 1 alpha subcomplex assembly factor 7
MQAKTLNCTEFKLPDGISVQWHEYLDQVPEEACFYIAHEFFDAMPTHRFEMTQHGLREILLDFAEDDSPFHFKYVLAGGPTTTSMVYEEGLELALGERREVSPDADVVTRLLSKCIASKGGCALIVDYGKDEHPSSSLRGIRQHAWVDPLSNPGTVDLSVDVDFANMKQVAEKCNVRAYGPVTQGHFLLSLGIQTRVQKLLESARGDKEMQERLISEYQRLVSPEEMGSIYKMLCIVPADSAQPIGF